MNGRFILFQAPLVTGDRIVPDGVVAITRRYAVQSAELSRRFPRCRACHRPGGEDRHLVVRPVTSGYSQHHVAAAVTARCSALMTTPVSATYSVHNSL